MKNFINNLFIALFIVCMVSSCGGGRNGDGREDRGENKEKPYATCISALSRCNSVYHWKTVFDLTEEERDFLHTHNVARIYLRMFDIEAEQNLVSGELDVNPIATTKFISEIPKDVEIVPVTYITLDALKVMRGSERKYASMIVKRLMAISSYNNCGKIKEIQLDCDWTKLTEKSYFTLCNCVKELLHKDSIALSTTIRLHQIKANSAVPPVDRGVLMLYNTGNIKSIETKNSILDIDNVKPYLNNKNYGLPLSYAYPAFGWGVMFKGEKFVSIVSDPSKSADMATAVAKAATDSTSVREERASVQEILTVKKLVESILGKPEGGNIIYHLDYEQLKNYSNNEISEIYSY